MKAIAFDLETTSVDIDEAEVCQVALVEAPCEVDEKGQAWLELSAEHVETSVTLCRVDSMPSEAFDVHKISAEMTQGALHFSQWAFAIAAAVEAEGVVLLTYNGMSYDVPILERFLGRKLRATHVDMIRVWQMVRASNPKTPWATAAGNTLTTDVFRGSLGGAHAFFTGETFDGAHDAAVDCLATLKTFDRTSSTFDEMLAWSTKPLPGDVDFDGKFKWKGSDAVCSFGKHRGDRLQDIPKSYLKWVLKPDSKFPEDTKTLVQAAMSGRYPKRSP